MATESIHATIERIYRAESRRVLATLIRLLGDFDVGGGSAARRLQGGARAVAARWRSGQSPRLARVGRTLQGDRRGSAAATRFDALDDVGEKADVAIDDTAAWADEESVEDDRLRLIFTCCHPALAPDAQVALTLREVCGLTTEEIARAFLTPAPTLAQRIVRAKAKIRDARIPYQVPARAELPERLDAVLRVIYLVFNEGYAASSGATVTRHDLSGEAIRLGRLLVELLPEPEARGTAGADAAPRFASRGPHVRRRARSILLEDQDRSLWNRESDRGGNALVEQALSSRRAGPYAIQAAIAAVHAEAPPRRRPTGTRSSASTTSCWAVDPSPVIELNRAVAIAMRDGPAAGLALIDADSGARRPCRLPAGARRARRTVPAPRANGGCARSFERALALTRQEPERRFLERRLEGGVPK